MTQPANAAGRARAAALVAAVVALLALAVLTAATAGPAPRDPGRPFEVPVDSAASSDTPPPDGEDDQNVDAQARRMHPLQVEVPVQDLVVVGVLVVGALVALFLRRRRKGSDDVPPPGPGPSLRAGPTAVADARPLIDRALAAAEHELADRGPREPRDAVVACWLRLEEGAAAAGVRRLPAQTPTEFTTALLTALLPGEAERAALEELRRSYAQARFGSSPLGDGAAERAAVALATVRAGLLAAGPVPAGLANPVGAGRMAARRRDGTGTV
jgi:Domain of unknown function (DUF4129)